MKMKISNKLSNIEIHVQISICWTVKFSFKFWAKILQSIIYIFRLYYKNKTVL